MKKIKNTLKLIITFIISVGIMITSSTNVFAAADTIQLGKATKTNAYIAGVSFFYKVTSDGQYLYCLDMHKETATNVKANMVKNSKKINGGLIYILKNGYPNKSITGDKEKDYYITQTAVWWYLDKTTGSSNLGDQFKENGSDAYNLRHYVQQLVNEGYEHRNDGMGVSEAKLSITTNTNQLIKQNDYYVSNEIKATTINNVTSYSVTLENAPAGTIIVKNGTETTYASSFTMNPNEAFQIKVPSASVKDSTLSIKVKATAKGEASYMAYEYQPENNSMQNVALLEKFQNDVASELVLSPTIVVEKVPVPDTLSMNSVIISLLGISILSAGILFIRKNGKRA